MPCCKPALAQLETRRRPAVSTSALTYPVALLMAEIGDACDGPADAMGDRIAHALRVAAAMPDLLTPELRAPRAGCYARHTIASRPRRPFHAARRSSGARASSARRMPTTPGAPMPSPRTPSPRRSTTSTPQSGKAVAGRYSATRAGLCLFRRRPGLNKSTGLVMPGAFGAISLHAYGVEGSRVGTHVNRLMDVAERER